MNMDGRDDVFRRPRLWSPDVYGDRCFYYDVFVSHSNGDESDELVEALRRHDVRVWYDKQQDMDDANWSTRIVWGLQASCSLICFVGSQPLNEHAWVRVEIKAGRIAAEAAGFDRVFVVLAGAKQDVPSWLIGDPIGLRYDFGSLSENAVQEFAARLRNLNRVSIDTSPPPFVALMQRARDVDASRRDQTHDIERWDTMSDLEFLQEYTAKALQKVARFQSADEVDGSDLTYTLYLVRVASDGLWPPPKQPVDGAEGIAAQLLADDLGLLASLPGLPTDTRGFVYVALGRLAQAGVTHAFDVLRACLRWEWENVLIAHVASTLTKYPQHRGRDDAVLTLLKSETFSDSWPLVLLAENDGVVRLRHHARRLTASEISALVPLKRSQELTAQMKQAIQNLRVVGVELVIYAAIPASGIAYSWSNLFRMDLGASIDAPTILPALVSQCARDWPIEHRAELWRLPFETIVFGPLNALDYKYGKSCGASDAMNAFVSALETPVAEHEMLLAGIPEDYQEHLIVRLGLRELQVRRSTIQALRRIANVTQNGDALDIAVYPTRGFLAAEAEDLSRLRARYRLTDPDLLKLRAQIRLHETSGVSQPEDIEMVLDSARRVVATWFDMPFC